MLKHIAIILFGLVVIGSAATQTHARERTRERRPILLLSESTRSARYAGADKTIWSLGFLNPVFVLYDDGLAVFKNDGDRFRLFSVVLASREKNTLLSAIDGFLKLEDSYTTTNQFHPPVYFIKYWQGSRMKKVSVIGPIRTSEEDRNKTPRAFLELFDQMVSFRHKKARLWEPETVEIDVYPLTDAQGEPVPWPKGWPDLSHKSTKKGRKGSYKIFLDGVNKDKLEQMLSSLKEEQAVLISHKHWYIAPRRYLLPNEQMWDTERTEGPWDTIRAREAR